MDEFLKEVEAFVYAAHKGQRRKYTNEMYARHPMNVGAKVAERADSSETMIAAAMLHDVLEDTKITSKQLREKFGGIVSSLVLQLTNPSKNHTDLPRAKRKQMDRDFLRTVSREAKIIKMHDRLDNISDFGDALETDRGFVKLYLEESRLLADVLGDADEKLYHELMKEIEKQEERVKENG